jgi:putative transposase
MDAGTIYHVLNRGNGRMSLFHKPADFAAFEKVLGQALERYPVDLLTYCLMNNHWHLLLRPREDGAVSAMMRWLGVTHVRRHHEHFNTRGGGHLYQGRFKSFPVQDDWHYLTVGRYIEANVVRAGIVTDVGDWEWGGFSARTKGGKPFRLAQWPVDRPNRWRQLLNENLPKIDLDRLRHSVNRGRPFGEENWIERTARQLGLQSKLRNPGRPKRDAE